jgi:predicted acyltransferase
MTKRLLSLDVFRGLTIAFMILVNNPGDWQNTYGPLLHADWHGCTPTDWVFPFFLYIVGVAIPLAVGARLERGDTQNAILKKVFSRTLIIFGLGLFLAAYPNFGMEQGGGLKTVHYLLLAAVMLAVFFREALNQKQFEGERNARIRRILGFAALAAAAGMIVIGFMAYDLSSLRIPGVLQRIALVYGACSLLFIKMNWKGMAWATAGLLLLYWALMTLVPVPGGYPPNLEAETNLGAWLDRTLMSGHLWSQAKTWDPEGLLSTLPSIGTGMIGVLTGIWIKAQRDEYKKLTGMLAFGAILMAAGLIWDPLFPINKKIWTSSYVLYTGGIALLLLGVTYWLIDVLDYKKWIKPFVVFGTNSLFAYILSGLIVKTLLQISWETPEGSKNAWGWTYQTLFEPFFSPHNASLAFAIANVLVCLAIVWVLYSRKIFIKV